jgi:hypothetical protein
LSLPIAPAGRGDRDFVRTLIERDLILEDGV